MASILDMPWNERLECLDSVDAGFFDLAKRATALLSELIMCDLKETFGKLFGKGSSFTFRLELASVLMVNAV